jgi:membrane protein implicated in regulation of membrane protease activity
LNREGRLKRRRCIGLRVAAIFGVFLAALNWGDWPIVAVGFAGAAFALIVYWRDCRKNRGKA